MLIHWLRSLFHTTALNSKRRRPVKRRSSHYRSNVPACVEMLESRRLLTTKFSMNVLAK